MATQKKPVAATTKRKPAAAPKPKDLPRIVIRVYKHRVKHPGVIIQQDDSSFVVEFEDGLKPMRFWHYMITDKKPRGDEYLNPGGQVWEVLHDVED